MNFPKTDPEILECIKESIRLFEAMPLEQMREMRNQQRRSWAIGELMLDHLEMTRDEAAKLIDACDSRGCHA